jgi:histone-lysine N-methyltransferase SETMAR
MQFASVLLHHDNARSHTVRATQERIPELQGELLERPPYRPDLPSSDFHLCGPLKKHLGGKRFADDEVAEKTVKRLLCCGFRRRVKRWDECIDVGGGYFEKCFSQVRISHVLRSISIYDLFTDSPSYE